MCLCLLPIKIVKNKSTYTPGSSRNNDSWRQAADRLLSFDAEPYGPDLYVRSNVSWFPSVRTETSPSLHTAPLPGRQNLTRISARGTFIRS